MMFTRRRNTVRKNQPLKKHATRRRGNKSSIAKKIIRWGIVTGIALVCLGGVWGFERVESVMTNLTTVQQVSVMGLKTLQRDEVLSELALSPESSLFEIKPDLMEQDLESHPWIRRASVQRVFPHTLAIRIVERKAAAILQSSKALYLLDEQAHILTVIDETEYPDLPRLIGVPSTFPNPKDETNQQHVRDGIRVAHMLYQEFGEVPTVNLEKSVVIVAAIQRLRFQFHDSIEEQWNRFKALYPSIATQISQEDTEVDLRYAGKVILRKRE